VKNPGFDQSLGLTNWFAHDPLVTFNNDDSDSCAGSGSAQLIYQASLVAWGLVKQWVQVTPNTNYWFGYRYTGPDSVLQTSVQFHAGTTCSGDVQGSIDLQTTAGSIATSWLSAWDSGTSPATAGSAQVCLQVSGTQTAWVDSIYLNAGANSY
jgi:hypothetical protein